MGKMGLFWSSEPGVNLLKEEKNLDGGPRGHSVHPLEQFGKDVAS